MKIVVTSEIDVWLIIQHSDGLIWHTLLNCVSLYEVFEPKFPKVSRAREYATAPAEANPYRFGRYNLA